MVQANDEGGPSAKIVQAQLASATEMLALRTAEVEGLRTEIESVRCTFQYLVVQPPICNC
jgi:hypothetical protein